MRIGKKGRRVGLALGGGGVRGLAAVPILKVLDECDIEPLFGDKHPSKPA